MNLKRRMSRIFVVFISGFEDIAIAYLQLEPENPDWPRVLADLNTSCESADRLLHGFKS